MMRDLTPLESRVAAIGLLVLVLVGMYLVMVRPYVNMKRAYAESRVIAQDRLLRYRAQASRREAILDQLEKIKSSEQVKGYYLAQPTPALASAEIQAKVKQAVRASGGQLVSTHVVAAQTDVGTVPVTVKVGMKGAVESVRKLFHSLESGRPMLFIDNVTLRALTTRRYNRRLKQKPPQLDVRFDLTAYVRLTAS